MTKSQSVTTKKVPFSDLHAILQPFTEFCWQSKNDETNFGVVVEIDKTSICIRTGFARDPKELVLSSNDLLGWEWFVVTRKGDVAVAEFLKWEKLKNHHAANTGVADAVQLALVDLAGRIETRTLDNLDYALLVCGVS